MMENYVVIDLEMTGLNVKTDRILEVGAARVRNQHVTETFCALVDPETDITERVTELTGISNEMAQNGEKAESVLPEFFAFLGEDILVGQNIIFDYSFLKQWAVNHNISFEKKAVDTLKLARKFLPEGQKKDLQSLCEFFEVERVNAHRALEDVMETQIIFEILKKRYMQEDPKAFEPVQLQYKVKKQTPATARQISYLEQFTKYHGIDMPQIPAGFTRSEASRLTDHLIETYGKMKKE